MPAPPSDAIIVGAGIVGVACAKELADAGLSVTVIESGPAVGCGATAAGMGHIAVMDDSDEQFALTSYSQRLWRELAAELPRGAEYLACGSLWVAADEEEFAEVRRKCSFYSARGIPVEILDSKQLSEAEPNLRSGMAGGLLMSNDGVCYPPCATGYLAETVSKRRGRIITGKRIAQVSTRCVRDEAGTTFEAELVILATGAVARQLVPGLEVVPRKGHLLITDRYPGFIRHQLIELGYLKSAHSSSADSVAFNAQPRQTGQILIGSSRQFGVEDSAVEASMLSRMLARAVEYMPRLAELSAIRSWTGFRAATPDKLPFIGRHAELDGVYLATGHEGLGISTSLATAKLLADEILGRASVIPRSPYAPTRSFAVHG
ncbi:MAG: FAD-dependent oxidoreductase [Acidobacteriaceae bacterium]|nr:FAD-dependent oxidoreductase [Acidobacteriaceae bacterium]